MGTEKEFNKISDLFSTNHLIGLAQKGLQKFMLEAMGK